MGQKVRWVWLALLLLAIISRLLGLDSRPLAPDEALRALASLDAVRGREWPPATESPLLLVGNAFLFALLGADDGIARLIPALAGAAVVMIPFLWRCYLGETGALAASTLLLMSPLTLRSARHLHGVAPGVLAASLLITLILRSLNDVETSKGRSFVIAFSGAALGLGLIAGPAFYDLLLPGLLISWLLWLRHPARTSNMVRPWPIILALGGALGTLVSVGLGLRWSGWFGIIDGASSWLISWRPEDGQTWGAGLLLFYEPLLITLALTGLGFLIRRRFPPSRLTLTWSLVGWALLTLLLTMVRPSDTATQLSAVVFPVALLGGYGVASLVRGLAPITLWWGGLHALAAFVLWLPGLLTLVRYARGQIYTNDPLLVIAGVVVVLALQILLVFIFGLVLPPRLLWRSAFAGLVAVFLVLQWSLAAGLGFVRANSPVEPAVEAVGSRDLWHMQDLVSEIAVLQELRRDALPVALVDKDADLTALVRWTLRSLDEVEVVATWPAEAERLVITPENAALIGPFNAEMWRGARFTALETYVAPIPGCEALLPPACSELLRWYLYRVSPYDTQLEGVILWQMNEP